jgi:signal transduction histidine kinase
MSSRAQPRRTRSIRFLLAVLFIVPLASLLALWGFAVSVTLSNAIQERNFNIQDQRIGAPAEALGAQLTLERLQSFVWLSSGRRAPSGPMLAQRRATDKAITAFKGGVAAGRGVMFAQGKPALAKFLAALAKLPTIRSQIDAGKLTPLAAFQAYNNIVNIQYQVYDNLILVDNVPVYQQSAASVQGGLGLELVGREIALVSGALANHGTMSNGERELFAQTVANQRLLMAGVLSELSPDLRSGYQRAYSSPAYRSFRAMENRVAGSVGTGGPIPIKPAAWSAASTTFLHEFEAGAEHDRVLLTASSAKVGDRLLLEFALAGGLGLLAVVASVYLLLRFGRRITQDLTGLKDVAQEMAEARLPQVVERLRRGEDVDLADAAPPLAVGRTAEVARVGDAFSTVLHTAVQAAVGQAELRKGVNQVFLNLAWRSQSLLHRQLAMLDSMERRSTSPDALDDLFRLDHLTTRMRRNAEGLTILSGAASARGWRHPVPVIDVLRGAIAEVEDYTRVSVLTQSDDAVVGPAVADVIHLVAELVENGTTFSPPETQVTVTAERAANGFVVEVEDRGLGFSPDELARCNERLAHTPEFDLAGSDQLGLFIVSRLAARHGIKVTLRPSPFGGTTAIVLMPHSTVLSAAEAGLESGGVGRSVLGRDGGGDLVRSIVGSAGLELEGPVVAGPPAAGGPDPDRERLAHTDRLPRVRDPAVRWYPAPWTESQPMPPSTLPASPAGTGPVAPVAPPPPEQTAAEPAAGMHFGLPRRVRQASLAPQLRDPAPPPAGPRSPADSQALLAAMQDGWQRGRADAAWHDHRPGEPDPPYDSDTPWGPDDRVAPDERRGPDGQSGSDQREGT